MVLQPSLGSERRQHITDGLALLGQQDSHRVGVITVWQSKCLTIVRLRVVEFVLLMHHGYLCITVVSMEELILRVTLIELLRPGTFEVDSIEQIADSIRVELVSREHLGNHAFCMVAAPLVDDAERLAVVKIARLRCCIVEGLRLTDEVRLQLVVFIHVDGVGYHHLRQFVQFGSLCQHLLAEGVDAVSPRHSKAQYLVNLCLRLASSTIVQHAQRIGDADGRYYFTLL